MNDKPESLADLSSDQLAALVELAEAYQHTKRSRRDVLKTAGIGGIAGLLAGSGAAFATEQGRTTQNRTTPTETGSDSAWTEGVVLDDRSSNPSTETVGRNQSVLYSRQGRPHWRHGDEPPIDLTAAAQRNSGTAVAVPGDVQSAIDAATENGGGIVRLDSTNRYDQPASPWVVREGVTLDFDGAFLRGTGDRHEIDLIHVHPGARVHGPRIDLYDEGQGYSQTNRYRGRVFSLDTRFASPYFADGTAIRNGNILAVGGTGTACYLGVNTEGPGSAISHLDLQFDVGTPAGSDAEMSVGTALHLDTTGAGNDGWINGVHVGGHWRYPRTGVLQTGVKGKYNQQVLNRFDVQIQPGENANAFWQIKHPTWARLNRWWGAIWDVGSFDYAWKIDSQYQDPDQSWRGCKRNAVNSPDLRAEYVRNRSPNTHYVTRTDSWQTTKV